MASLDTRMNSNSVHFPQPTPALKYICPSLVFRKLGSRWSGRENGFYSYIRTFYSPPNPRDLMLSNRTFCNDENVLRLYCPNMVATGHKYLLSTWNVAVQLSNWILLFRLNSFSLKRSHVAALEKAVLQPVPGTPCPRWRKLDSELSSVKWSWFCLRNKSLLSHSVASQGQSHKREFSLFCIQNQNQWPICSFGDLNSGSLLRFL